MKGFSNDYLQFVYTDFFVWKQGEGCTGCKDDGVEDVRVGDEEKDGIDYHANKERIDPSKKLNAEDEDEEFSHRNSVREVNDMSYFLNIMNETRHIVAFTSVVQRCVYVVMLCNRSIRVSSHVVLKL